MIAERLKKLRKARGLTKAALGRTLGLAKQTIYGYEKGERNPDLETLVRMADLFGVSTDYLLGYSDSPAHNAPDEQTARELDEKQAELERIAQDVVKIANRLSVSKKG